MLQTRRIVTNYVVGKLNINAILALAGIIGPIILVIADFTAGLTASHYNFFRDSISSLAWTRLGFLQTIGFLAIGLLVELFVAGLFLSIRGVRGFGFGLGILVFFGFGLLLIGAFHTDPVNGTHTVEGTIHGWVAKGIFWLFPIAVGLISPSFKKHPYWRPLFKYSLVAAILSVVIMIASLWFKEESGWFGLFERILVADEIIWVEIVAIKLFQLSTRKEIRPHFV